MPKKKPKIEGLGTPTNRQEIESLFVGDDAQRLALNDNLIKLLREPLVDKSINPVDKPENFRDMFRLYNGYLYIYISGTWTKIAKSSDVGTSTLQVARGTGSRGTGDGTGDQAITGVGFTPTLVRISAMGDSVYMGQSEGSGDGSGYGCVQNADGIAGKTNANIIFVMKDASDESKATLKSLDSDGFTLTWAEVSVDCNFSYECFGYE